MLRLAADENFNADIVRGLLRRLPDLDIVRLQDAGLSGAEDTSVLEWAAREGRIVLTHDISTLVSSAVERVAAGERTDARRVRGALAWAHRSDDRRSPASRRMQR